jgi:hypothetical protein
MSLSVRSWPRGPLVRVVSSYDGDYVGTTKLSLACGHSVIRQTSRSRGKAARCVWCWMALQRKPKRKVP